MIRYEDLLNYAEENNLQIKLFDNPSFPNSIIGLTQDYRAVYDMELMIADLMAEDNMDYTDALDFIEYNTLRALPYAGSDAPIVLYQKEIN